MEVILLKKLHNISKYQIIMHIFRWFLQKNCIFLNNVVYYYVDADLEKQIK